MSIAGALLFIIFGSKYREKEYDRAWPVQCPQCRNECYYRPVKQRKWFHVFWIPIIPWRKQYWLSCPVCETGYKLNKTLFKDAKRMAEYTSLRLDGRLSDEEYAAALEEFDQFFVDDSDGQEGAPDMEEEIEENIRRNREHRGGGQDDLGDRGFQ